MDPRVERPSCTGAAVWPYAVWFCQWLIRYEYVFTLYISLHCNVFHILVWNNFESSASMCDQDSSSLLLNLFANSTFLLFYFFLSCQKTQGIIWHAAHWETLILYCNAAIFFFLRAADQRQSELGCDCGVASLTTEEDHSQHVPVKQILLSFVLFCFVLKQKKKKGEKRKKITPSFGHYDNLHGCFCQTGYTFNSLILILLFEIWWRWTVLTKCDASSAGGNNGNRWRV